MKNMVYLVKPICNIQARGPLSTAALPPSNRELIARIQIYGRRHDFTVPEDFFLLLRDDVH